MTRRLFLRVITLEHVVPFPTLMGVGRFWRAMMKLRRRGTRRLPFNPTFLVTFVSGQKITPRVIWFLVTVKPFLADISRYDQIISRVIRKGSSEG